MRRTLALLTLMLLAPGVAHAAWSDQDLGSAHTFVDDPGVIVSGNGGALATWRFQQGLGNGGRAGFEGAGRAPGATGFGAPFAIVPATSINRPLTTVAGLEPYGKSGALLALIGPGRAGAPQARLGVRFGSIGGRFGALRTIRRARAYTIARASLAVNPRGDAALAWFEDRGVNTDRVYVALRRAGKAFGKPRRLATGRIRGVAAAIGARGDALVAWDARGVLRTRFKPRARAGFGSTDTIRSEPAYFAEMAPVVTPSGRAVLAWSAQFASEGGDRGPVHVQAAIRPERARRFRRAQELIVIPAGIYDGLGRVVDAVVDSTGHAVVAYNGGETTRRIPHLPHDKPVYVDRDTGGRGGLEGLGQASGEGEVAVLSDLAAGPGGRLAVVWDGGVENPQSVVRAAIADGPGAAFGPPEDVSAAGREARFGHAVFLGDRPVVVLSSRATGGADSVAQAYVR